MDQAARTFAATHQYKDDNPTGTASDVYTITGTVTDDDGGSFSTLELMDTYSTTASTDFSKISNTDSDEWSYRYALDANRDGDYPLLSQFNPGVIPVTPGPALGSWNTDANPNWFVQVNDTAETQRLWGITWPAGEMMIHPMTTGGWWSVSWRTPDQWFC